MEQTKKGKCPVFHGTNTTTEQNHQHWWPNALNSLCISFNLGK